ncbi:MAG TPA: Sec-independent protein translocase protein TatB [Candidatus Cybelea sp.]|nr:Sec-independent protein translocase protein TatB [Candidatus Cybelea sp.]
MFDIAWSEMAIIAAVALVVIGPKDLPRVLKTIGQMTAKARAMAREFQNSLDELAREAELESLKKDVEQAAGLDVANEIKAAVDPDGEMAKTIQATEAEMAAVAAPVSAAEPAAESLPVPEPANTPEPAPALEPETAPMPVAKTGTQA